MTELNELSNAKEIEEQLKNLSNVIKDKLSYFLKSLGTKEITFKRSLFLSKLDEEKLTGLVINEEDNLLYLVIDDSNQYLRKTEDVFVEELIWSIKELEAGRYKIID